MEALVLDQSGHTKHKWNPKNPDDVAAARAVFDTLTKKGYAAFRVDSFGGEGEKIKTFDPNAKKMLFAPALQGG